MVKKGEINESNNLQRLGIRAMLAGKKRMTRMLMKEQPPNDKYTLHTLIDTTNNDKRKFIGMYAWLLPDVIINYSEKYFKCPFSGWWGTSFTQKRHGRTRITEITLEK